MGGVGSAIGIITNKTYARKIALEMCAMSFRFFLSIKKIILPAINVWIIASKKKRDKFTPKLLAKTYPVV